MDVEETATVIVDAAFHIHVRLGPGLLESVYEALLAYELMRRGCHVAPLGLLVNFGGVTMKEGLFRVVNHHDEARSPLRMHQPLERISTKKWVTWLRRWGRSSAG